MPLNKPTPRTRSRREVVTNVPLSDGNSERKEPPPNLRAFGFSHLLRYFDRNMYRSANAQMFYSQTSRHQFPDGKTLSYCEMKTPSQSAATIDRPGLAGPDPVLCAPEDQGRLLMTIERRVYLPPDT